MDKVKYRVREFTNYFFQMRLLIFILIQFFIIHYYSSPIKRFLILADYPVTPWIAPFMMLNVYFLFIYGITVIYFYSNVPFMQYSQMYQLVRLGRKKWGIEKIIRIWMSAVALATIELFLSILPLVPRLELSKDWGKVIYTLAMTDAASQFNINIFFPYDIVSSFTPIKAMLLIWGILILVTGLIGMVMFSFSLLFSRTLGIVIATIIAILPIVFFNIHYQLGWIVYFSPLSWLNLSLLHGKISKIYPNIWYVFYSILGMTIILCLLSVRKIKETDFLWMREE